MTADFIPRSEGPEHTHDHKVAFYQHDDELVEVAAGWFRAALQHDESVVIIATDIHREQFCAALRGDLDVDGAIADERLILLDAAEVLAGFMVADAPDRGRFDATVGDLVRRTVAKGHGVKAFGEMVALLWHDRNSDAALALEALWHELQGECGFDLFCAYPRRIVVTEDSAEGFVAIAAAHTSIAKGPPAAVDAEVVCHFPAHVDSPRLVRRLVQQTLSQWGISDLNDEATLVASELAANAVRHARSDFAVSLARSARGLRIAVGDTAATFPISQPHDLGRSGGRGLQIVAATAQDWGHEKLEAGKLVWAELSTSSGGDSR